MVYILFCIIIIIIFHKNKEFLLILYTKIIIHKITKIIKYIFYKKNHKIPKLLNCPISIRSDSPTFPTSLQTCKMSKTSKLNRLIWHPQRYHHRVSGSRPRPEQGRCLFLSKGTERWRGKLHFEIAWPKRDYTEKSLFEKSVWEVIFLRRTVYPKWDLNSNRPRKKHNSNKKSNKLK